MRNLVGGLLLVALSPLAQGRPAGLLYVPITDVVLPELVAEIDEGRQRLELVPNHPSPDPIIAEYKDEGLRFLVLGGERLLPLTANMERTVALRLFDAQGLDPKLRLAPVSAASPQLISYAQLAAFETLRQGAEPPSGNHDFFPRKLGLSLWAIVILLSVIGTGCLLKTGPSSATKPRASRSSRPTRNTF